MIIEKKDVVTFVADKVVDYFKNVEEVPTKLDVQRCIGQVTENVEVHMGQKRVKETVFENGQKITKEYDKEITKPLIDYYVKISLSEVKAIQEKILQNISTVKWNESQEKGNPVELLKQLKAFGWMIESDSVVDFIMEIVKLMAHTRNQTVNDEKYYGAIYLKGEVEGGGKSTFLHAIEDGFNAGNVRVEQALWPTGRFCNVLPYCKNPIVYIEDTSNQTKKEIIEDKLKAILRKERVECEKKGLNAITMKANAGIIAAGNVEPPMAKDRGWKVFDVLPVEIAGKFGSTALWESIKTASKQYARGIDEIYKNYDFYYFYNLLLKIQKNEKDKIFKKEKKIIKSQPACTSFIPDRLRNRLKGLPTLLAVLNKMQDGPYNFTKISPKEIMDFMEEMPQSFHLDSWIIVSTLKLLAANDVIGKYRQQTLDIYQKYDLKGLETLKYEEAFETPSEVIEEKTLTIEEQVEETLKKWDEIIAIFENEPQPTKKEKENKKVVVKVKKETIETKEKGENKMMTLGEIEKQEKEKEKEIGEIIPIDEEYTTFNIAGKVKEDEKGKRFVMKFTRKTDKQIFYKTYWCYNENGYNERETSQLAHDMQQIYMSKGRDFESDEHFQKFVLRCMACIRGEQQFHIASSCALKTVGNKVVDVYAWED